jgi:uncharacterized SAM-binding protein YcdF (DUF218 family)
MIIAFFLGILLGIAASCSFCKLPDLLTIDQSPEKADAIVVLAGDSDGSRVERAAQLFHEGYSDKLIISGGSIYRDVTWASLIRKRALELGIPADNIILQERSVTTWEDAYYSTEILHSMKATKVLVVTSSWHSRRSIACFNRADANILWISTPCTAHGKQWWRDPNTTRAVISELLKFCWPEKEPDAPAGN